MKRLNVDIPDGLHRQLKLAAFSQGQTVSEVVIKLLHDYLEAEQSHHRRRITDYAA